MREVRCADCSTLLATGGVPPQPCPECGSESIAVSASVQPFGPAELDITAKLRTVARSSNDARAYIRQLQVAIGAAEAALDARKVTEIHEAVKQALEAIHELDDGRRERGEWEQAGWSQDQIGTWRGLVGARNGVHHNNVPCVGLHSPAEGDDRLRWEIEQAAIEKLDSKGQQRDYAAHVAQRK